MARSLWLVVGLVMAGCATSGGSPAASNPTTTPPAPTTIPVPTTRLVECGGVPYEVGILPPGVSQDPTSAVDIPFDDYTTVPGSRSRLWLRDDGGLAVSLIRGTLPLTDWPGERGRVSIDGAEGVAGLFDDGSWVVAWFEDTGDRCDRYTMVFYPPVASSDVETTIASMDRTAG